MTDDRTITRLGTDDLPAVRALLEQAGLVVDLEAELRREIALPWVLRGHRSGEIVAFSLAWSVADELHLLDMATLPEERRRGHGRALLAALLALARAEHKRLLLLEVRCSNAPAIALYEASGFSKTGVRRGYYSEPTEDALEMRITLDTRSGEVLPEAP